MKIPKNFLTVFLLFVSSYCFAQSTDTLIVSQSDTNFFKMQMFHVRAHYSPIPDFIRPKSGSPFEHRYELINPQNGAYYFIYNEKKQLVEEGIYSVRKYAYKDKTEERGAFYDSKTYYYKKNGKLISIHYMQDGRSHKTEYFDNKKRLKKIKYIDKKSSNTEKIEFYKKGQLKETIMYTRFDNTTKRK